MKHSFMALSLGLGALLVATEFANARSSVNCGPRDAVVARLQDIYGETRQSMGLGTDNTMVEVFASPATGSWTIIVTRPDGLACLVAAGEAFEALAEAQEAPGSDV